MQGFAQASGLLPVDVQALAAAGWPCGAMLAAVGLSAAWMLAWGFAALIPIAAVLEAARLPESQPPTRQEESPADLVTRALEQQLQRSFNRTLEQMSLEELLFDWRSAKASQEDDGGLLIG